MKPLHINSMGEMSRGDYLINTPGYLSDVPLFDRDDWAAALLTEDEFTLYQKWCVSNGFCGPLFRVNVSDGRLWLSTEFIYFDELKDTDKAVREFAAETAGELDVVDHSRHYDRHKKAGETEWTAGEHDGKMETRVSVDWDVTDLTAGGRGIEMIIGLLAAKIRAVDLDSFWLAVV